MRRTAPRNWWVGRLPSSRRCCAGFTVPNGFCITTRAYEQFVAETGLATCVALELGRKSLDRRGGKSCGMLRYASDLSSSRGNTRIHLRGNLPCLGGTRRRQRCSRSLIGAGRRLATRVLRWVARIDRGCAGSPSRTRRGPDGVGFPLVGRRIALSSRAGVGPATQPDGRAGPSNEIC